MTSERDRANALLRSFAKQTNLLIASRPIGASPEDHPVALELLATAASLGALPPLPGAASHVEFDVEAGTFTLGGEVPPERASADSRLDFALANMPVSREFAAGLAASGRVAGLRIGVAMTLEPKTANLALLLRDAGADVSVYAHPDETDEEVAAALRSRGVAVDADSLLSGQEELDAALGFLGRGFDVLMDDGSHLIRLAHEAAPHLVGQWLGATEETTSGLTPLRLMERTGALATPVVAVNDAATKTLFDNRYGTGQSCVFAIADLLEAMGRSVTEQPALVIGYGPVGVGVAAVLLALGAMVSVAETDPVRALVAAHDGFPVVSALAGAQGALVVSATGVKGTVTADLASAAAIVAVAGGVPGEVDGSAILSSEAGRGGALVLAQGGCINVVAAEGNPIEVMDLSFATQLAGLDFLLAARPGIGVHPLPADAVAEVAAAAVRARGLAVGQAAAPGGPDASDWTSTRYRRNPS